MSATIIKTLHEMFQQRGYTDIQEEKNMIIGYDQKNKVVAITDIISKLNVEEIKNIFNVMTDEQTNHCIIVHFGEPTPAVNNTIANTANIHMTIELFQDIDLQFNITKHILVPLHEKVSKEEIKELKEKISLKNLPKISRKDPVVRFYNFNKGEVIRVTRRGGEICYRIVIN